MNYIDFCFTLFGLLSNQMTQCSARGLSSIELKICISDSLTDGICSNNLFEQMKGKFNWSKLKHCSR